MFTVIAHQLSAINAQHRPSLYAIYSGRYCKVVGGSSERVERQPRSITGGQGAKSQCVTGAETLLKDGEKSLMEAFRVLDINGGDLLYLQCFASCIV